MWYYSSYGHCYAIEFLAMVCLFWFLFEKSRAKGPILARRPTNREVPRSIGILPMWGVILPHISTTLFQRTKSNAQIEQAID